MIKLLDIINSKIDKTVKYVFQLDDSLIMEMAYIDNNTGKDIICVSAQTACAMRCKFCHTTDYVDKLKIRNISCSELVTGIQSLMNEQPILWENKRMLLISYMGCGEPLLNEINVFDSMYLLQQSFKNIRFAIATMIPRFDWMAFVNLTNSIKRYRLPVKMHLSLHFPTDEVRREWMPNALDIKPSLDLMEFYKHLTGNGIEAHYTPIKDINNCSEDMASLALLLFRRNIPIKFLKFNKKATLDADEGEINVERLADLGIKYEFYTPPGLDIGASCGQFLFDYHLKYNEK